MAVNAPVIRISGTASDEPKWLAGHCKELRDGLSASREWLTGRCKELRDGWLLAIWL
jgi:hypothetical protein